MQVLYVEDDRELASSVQMMLHRQGHFCHTTRLGQEALRLAKRNDYDIVVLDIMLPDIDGYEVLERMEAQSIELPYLLQSGLVDRDADPEGLGFGVEVFLSKPFTIEEMLERIGRVLDGGGNRGPSGRPPLADERRFRGRTGPDRRSHRRFSTLKRAGILVGGADLDCVVLNMSHGGAALRLPEDWTGGARRITLELTGETPRECRVCWHLGNKVGVKFI